MKQKFFRASLVFSTIAGLMINPLSVVKVFAQATAAPTNPGISFIIPRPASATINDPAKAISFFVALAFIVAGLLAFFFLILGGIKWITSGGDKAGLEAARNQIVHALVGLIVVIASWALIVLMERILNINIFNFTLPSPSG